MEEVDLEEVEFDILEDDYSGNSLAQPVPCH
jgi:hypothetical protein